MNIQIGKKNFFTPSIVIVLVSAFLLRIILSPFGTLALDQNTFIAWSERLVSLGFGKFYFGAWSDYLPGYLYILYILGQIAKFNIIPTTILFKLPAILSDLGTGYLIFKIVSKLKNDKWGILSACLYLFNPAIIANSTIWGQVDGLTAFFSILALYALEINPLISAFALAAGTVVKPQLALVSLVILFMTLKKKWKMGKIATYIISSLLMFLAFFIPFAGGENLATFIPGRIITSLNQYPYTSVNAFNLWAIYGTWKPDAGITIVGGLVVLILFFAVGLRFLEKKGGEYILLSFLYAASFLFMTRMHERHMLPALAPLTVAVAVSPAFVFSLVGFSFIYLANLYWAWNWVTNSFQQVFGDFTVKFLSLINVLLLSVFIIPKTFYSFFEKINKKFLLHKIQENKKPPVETKLEKPNISIKTLKILFIGVVIFASITRFYNLYSPTSHYFDEVYHAFTAEEMLHGVTDAWEWWNPNPTGFAHEWTHPPLAKEGMVIGMSLLGETSFGWRFPGALLGVGSVILVYFIAKEIFDDELVGLLSSALLALDGLTLVTSRIGMNDTYMLFFALASILSYLKKKNFWSAVFFGLSLASKWSALWVVPIIFVCHFVFKRNFKLSYIFFFLLPPLIYISSYFPIFTNPQIQSEYITNANYALKPDKVGIPSLDMFIDVQKQMWWYHTRLKATHPYSSMWYTWPFMVRPIYLYTSNEIDGTVARIYAMGNPAIFWGGAVSIVVLSYFAVSGRNKKLGFVVFSYLVFFTPWAVSPRIMFLYHYLPSIPFMAIGTAYILRRFPKLIPFFLALSLILFIYFYPHWAGLKIPISLDTSYYWFTSWR